MTEQSIVGSHGASLQHALPHERKYCIGHSHAHCVLLCKKRHCFDESHGKDLAADFSHVSISCSIYFVHVNALDMKDLSLNAHPRYLTNSDRSVHNDEGR